LLGFWAGFEKQIYFFKPWQFGGYSWLIETVFAGAKKTHFAYTKKYKGVKLNPLKMWPYIFLFS